MTPGSGSVLAVLMAVLAVLLWPLPFPAWSGRWTRSDPLGRRPPRGWGGRVDDTGVREAWWRWVLARGGGRRGDDDGRWVLARGGGRRGDEDGRWVADLAEVVAVGLDAGLDLMAAALAAARSPGVVRRAPWVVERLHEAAVAGTPVSACLDPPPGVPPAVRRDLDVLVAAWRLAEEAGAPAAEVTAAAAGAVRERRAARLRAAVAVAGPRTSMWLLTALPLLGPVGGALVGFGPERLYASGPARTVALTGLVLTAGGWWWARAVLMRAARPATTGAPDPTDPRPDRLCGTGRAGVRRRAG